MCKLGKQIIVAVSAIFLFIGSVSADYVPGEILIKFKPSHTISAMEASTYEKSVAVVSSNVNELSRRCNVSVPLVKRWEKSIGLTVLKFSSETDIIPILEKYRSDPSVEYAEPNYIRHASVTTNDTYYNLQWGIVKIKADEAWDIDKGDTSIIVAVLDTGVDSNHPDLQAKLYSGYDFVNNDPDSDDDNGHGTHVAGIIGAITNNTEGVAGTSWYCRIMPVKVLDSAGSGNDGDIASGLLYASVNGVKIINMSFGAVGTSSTLNNALSTAYDRGCVLIAAAGNDGVSVEFYPAAYEKCIAVSATDSNDLKASFSNYGSWIDVAAPGVNILSTLPGNNYGYESGTSMAVPFVSGVAALVFARYPNSSNSEVELRLKLGTDDIGPIGKDIYFGYGRINALKAIGNYLTLVDEIKMYTFPNPLRLDQKATIVIKDVPLKAGLTVKIYNIAGELIREFSEDKIKLHTNTDYAYVEWDGKNTDGQIVSAGVYIAVVRDGERMGTEKIVVLK